MGKIRKPKKSAVPHDFIEWANNYFKDWDDSRTLEKLTLRQLATLQRNIERAAQALADARQKASVLLDLPSNERVDLMARGKVDQFTIYMMAQMASESRAARRKGGKRHGISKATQINHEQMREQAKQLIADGKDPSAVRGILARDYGYTTRQVRNILPSQKRK